MQEHDGQQGTLPYVHVALRYVFVVIHSTGTGTPPAAARVPRARTPDGGGKDQTLANRALTRVREQVEGEAQGEDDALQKFFKDVDDGPRHARVVQLTKEDRAVVEDETSFSVRH